MDQTLCGSFIDDAMERRFGEVLRKVLCEQFEDPFLDIDVPFFYFYLALVRHLADGTVPQPRPTPEMAEMLEEEAVTREEFQNSFVRVAERLLEEAPEAEDFLPSEVMDWAERAAADASLLQWGSAEMLH